MRCAVRPRSALSGLTIQRCGSRQGQQSLNVVWQHIIAPVDGERAPVRLDRAPSPARAGANRQVGMLAGRLHQLNNIVAQAIVHAHRPYILRQGREYRRRRQRW